MAYRVGLSSNKRALEPQRPDFACTLDGVTNRKKGATLEFQGSAWWLVGLSNHLSLDSSPQFIALLLYYLPNWPYVGYSNPKPQNGPKALSQDQHTLNYESLEPQGQLWVPGPEST